MKFYRLASGFPTKSGSLLPTKRGRELPTLTMHAKNIQSPMFNDGQIHIAKWVRNALDLNDGDELLFEVVG